MAAAILRVGRIYVREDGTTVVDGWHIARGVDELKPEVREWTDEDWRDWIAHWPGAGGWRPGTLNRPIPCYLWSQRNRPQEAACRSPS